MVGLTSRSSTSCPRCGGFWALQDLRDFAFDGAWHQGKRCVNCGCILDSVIQYHQRHPEACRPTRFRVRYLAPRAVRQKGRL